jgi:GT2 family glycosyltransferase
VKISVVIPSYESCRELELCLISLGHCVDPDLDFEVVVVDDGSSDGTWAMLDGFAAAYPLISVFIPRTETSGRAAARNAGIARATGDVVLMVDADSIVTPGLIAEHVRYHRLRPDVVVIGSRHELKPGHVDVDQLRHRFTLTALPRLSRGDDRERVFGVFSANLNNLATRWHYLYSCNVSVRREHLTAVGCFDERFRGWGFEDTELGWRLWRRGLAFAYNPDAIVYHQQAHDMSPRLYAQWRRNLGRFTAKYPREPVIALQSILASEIDWLDSMCRFEYAARALVGRMPSDVAYDVVTVDDENVSDVVRRLPAWAASADLIIVDETSRTGVDAVVQCVDTPRELLYYRNPSPVERVRLVAAGRMQRRWTQWPSDGVR